MSSRGSVYRRGAKWVAHVKWRHTDGTYKQRKITRPTRKEAEAALTELLRAIDLGVAVPVDQLTVAGYIEGWLDHLEHVVGRKPSTVAGYRNTLDVHTLPTIGDMRIQQVTTLDIDRIYRTMAGKGLSARTIRLQHSILAKAFGDAVRQGILATSPVSRATPPSTTAARAPQFQTWTFDELGRFLDSIEGRGRAEPIVFAALTGARLSEVVGLRWSDLDLDRRQAVITQAVVPVDGELVAGDTKNHRARPVALDDNLVAMLRRHRAAQAQWRLQVGGYWVERDLVFPGPDGDFMKPGGLTQQFDRLVAKADVPRIRFHDLRHTHGTLLIEAGRDPKLVSERLGHATVAFTLDRYVHPSTAQQLDAANDFSRRLAQRSS